MSTKPALLRAEPHATVGAVLLRDAGVVIDRWAKRAAEEQPSARRVHHDVLLDHLPAFLWELGRSLADAGGKEPHRLTRPANVHGDQRWEAGWSIEEVVRDYQLLRVVVTEYLDETLDRPLSTREVLSLGVFIDDAIAASVSAFTANRNATSSDPAGPGAGESSGREDLFGVLGVLGHELRNPLAPLANAVQILKVSPGDKPAVERASAMMDRQVKVMTRLVDDILDLPRLARAKMRLSPARLDLSELVRNVVEDAKPGYDAAGIALGLEVPTVAVVTTGDAQRLSQVIGNLLANGLKFTNRGGEVRVRLTVDLERRVAGVSVRDTGIGIERSLIPSVFEPFVQADRSLERSRGGLGLGLALVKGLVELHGGTVWAESDGPGKGSEFGLELPLIEQPAAAAPPEAEVSAASRRVLVIEDNRDSAESLKEYLELCGHAVTLAPSGPDGIAAAHASVPEVVVCDIGLPGMSGHDVCKELRKAPKLSGTLFLALSGHAIDGDAPADGFDLYLLKPVDLARIAELISKGRPAAAPKA